MHKSTRSLFYTPFGWFLGFWWALVCCLGIAYLRVSHNGGVHWGPLGIHMDYAEIMQGPYLGFYRESFRKSPICYKDYRACGVSGVDLQSPWLPSARHGPLKGSALSCTGCRPKVYMGVLLGIYTGYLGDISD